MSFVSSVQIAKESIVILTVLRLKQISTLSSFADYDHEIVKSREKTPKSKKRMPRSRTSWLGPCGSRIRDFHRRSPYTLLKKSALSTPFGRVPESFSYREITIFNTPALWQPLQTPPLLHQPLPQPTDPAKRASERLIRRQSCPKRPQSYWNGWVHPSPERCEPALLYVRRT